MKSAHITMIAVAILVLVAVTIYSVAPREPVYQGKSLSWWIEQYHGSFSTLGPMSPRAIEDESKARTAIKAIGTNAIPTLLKWMQTPESPLKEKINSLLARQRIITLQFQTAERKWSLAVNGFHVLENDGLPAIPALSPLLSSPSELQRQLAFECMTDIDRKNTLFPIFLQCCQNSNADVRLLAESYLEWNYPAEVIKTSFYKAISELKFSATNIAGSSSTSD